MIKRLGRDDVEQQKELRGVFSKAFDEDYWNDVVPDDRYLIDVLNDENTIILASFNVEGKVVGGLVAYVLKKIDKKGSELYLYDLAVNENFRREGRATKLIEELRSIGRKIGSYVIFVQADDVDEPAIALYTKLSKSAEKGITHFNIEI